MIVSLNDRNDKIYLLIVVQDTTTYNRFEKLEKYDLNVYVEAVSDRENDVIRFMYTFLQEMKFKFEVFSFDSVIIYYTIKTIKMEIQIMMK